MTCRPADPPRAYRFHKGLRSLKFVPTRTMHTCIYRRLVPRRVVFGSVVVLLGRLYPNGGIHTVVQLLRTNRDGSVRQARAVKRR